MNGPDCGMQAVRADESLTQLTSRLGAAVRHAGMLARVTEQMRSHLEGPFPTGDKPKGPPTRSGVVFDLSNLLDDMQERLREIDQHLLAVNSRLGVPPLKETAAQPEMKPRYGLNQ